MGVLRGSPSRPPTTASRRRSAESSSRLDGNHPAAGLRDAGCIDDHRRVAGGKKREKFGTERIGRPVARLLRRTAGRQDEAQGNTRQMVAAGHVVESVSCASPRWTVQNRHLMDGQNRHFSGGRDE
jgi:hypothetical protein